MLTVRKAGQIDDYSELTLTDTHGNIDVCGNEQFEVGRDLEW